MPSGVYCEAYTDRNPTGVCGAELPCPAHSQERCSAHGRTVAEHTGGYADDCTAPPPSREGVPMGHCPSCGTYAETRMHWDTCQYRGRNVRDEVLRQGPAATFPREPALPPPSLLWSAQPDVELQALAEIVAALQRLTPPVRARVLRYLNHRYEPSDRGPGSAPPR